MMNASVLITARLKSTRLPAKVLLDFASRPAIVHLLERIRRAHRVQTAVICTSTHPQDDPLEAIATQERVGCYRGSEDDVLRRLLEAARTYRVGYIVNVTADCPLVDPIHIDAVVETYERTHADLITANRLPTGQGLWGIDIKALTQVCTMKGEIETEVWGDYFSKSGMFRVHDLEIDPDYEHATLKTSLDYPEDYTFLRRLFDELYVPGTIFSLADMLRVVRQKPELLSINGACKARGLQHAAHTTTSMRLKHQWSQLA